MRWLIGLFCLVGVVSAQELDDARVQISYKELKELLEASVKKSAESPVASAILSATYTVKWEKSSATARVEFDLQTFREGPQIVPLLDHNLIIETVEPAESVLLRREGYYAIALEGKSRSRVVVGFSLPIGSEAGDRTVRWAVSPAVRTLVEVVSTGPSVQVPGGVQIAGGNQWRLGSAEHIVLTQAEPPIPMPPPVTMPAVVHQMTSEMRVVEGGAYVNKMVWRIRHDAPLDWRLNLSDAHQLVSSRIGGRAVSPSRPDATSLEFRLPENRGDETVVELSYTGKVAPFEPVRGDLSLQLPATDLLVELIDWRVSLPAAYQTVASQGNVEFLPAGKSGGIVLRKELCQGESPGVRLFYEKPETSTKP